MGAYHVSWNFRSMSAVVLAKDSRDPSASWAYGVPLKIAARSFV